MTKKLEVQQCKSKRKISRPLNRSKDMYKKRCTETQRHQSLGGGHLRLSHQNGKEKSTYGQKVLYKLTGILRKDGKDTRIIHDGCQK